MRNLIASWTVPEPAKEIEQAPEDAILFRIEPEDRPAATNEAGTASIFRDIDRIQPHVWILLALVGAWVLLLMSCAVAPCILSATR